MTVAFASPTMLPSERCAASLSVASRVRETVELMGGAIVESMGGKIVGGIPANIQEHPWQVAISVKSSGNRYLLCGGSIIGEDRLWILTAAHCFGKAGKDAIVRVRSGASDLDIAKFKSERCGRGVAPRADPARARDHA